MADNVNLKEKGKEKGPPGRVLIVEDHAVLAGGLAVMLERAGHVVGTPGPASGLDELVERARGFDPDVVVLDIHLQGAIGDSYPLIPALTAEGAVVLVLTGENDPVELGRCLELGAAGVATKDQPLDEVLSLIEGALQGAPLLGPRRRLELLEALRRHREQELARLRPFLSLTRREQSVLAELMEGRSAEAVARSSFVSVATVRSHIRSILAKLGVRNQLQAVAEARRSGWSGPGGHPN